MLKSLYLQAHAIPELSLLLLLLLPANSCSSRADRGSDGGNSHGCLLSAPGLVQRLSPLAPGRHTLLGLLGVCRLDSGNSLLVLEGVHVNLHGQEAAHA